MVTLATRILDTWSSALQPLALVYCHLCQCIRYNHVALGHLSIADVRWPAID